VISIRVELDGPIEKLFESPVYLHIVFGSHHIVVPLPVLRLDQMLLDLARFLHRLTDLLNNPTLFDKVR
jgi:hypothetical protein